MFWKKKEEASAKKVERAPFKTGDIVSDGKDRMIVNVVFKRGNEWRMLVGSQEWIWKENIATLCLDTSFE